MVAVGTRLGPYEILAPLGAGGMGEVYRARDARLARDVAVKILPEAVARDPERIARFEREAQALAALSHPCLLAIHDVGREGEIAYAVTELLEGETLRERLTRETLPWRKAVEIASSIAEGLACAHEHAVVHRDVKPENIFLTTDGRVKVLDFGLARVEAAAAGRDSDLPTPSSPSPRTRTGAVVGTVGYMSPEQVKGEAADHRADLFALGLLLHEMLAGTRAFVRETAAETMTAILREPAPELHLTESSATPDLVRIVSRCLEKAPGERFQSARDLAFALRSALAGSTSVRPIPGLQPAPPAERHSIAVLPFANLSAEPEQEYFCDGMTAELISGLSGVRVFAIVSRSSVMSLKGTQKKARQLAEELGVRYLLEGSVRKAGSQIRVTAQLVDAARDVHLWAEKYSGTLEDVLDIQEKVARAIVAALALKLSPEADRRLSARAIPDPVAYECYLRAQHEVWRFTGEGLDRAVALLDQALGIVGPNARLYGALGNAYFQYWNSGVRIDEAVLTKAEGCAANALALEPGCPQAHVVFGLLRGFVNPRLGIAHLKTALAGDPDDALALEWLWALYTFVGRSGQARACLERTQRVDPLSPFLALAEARTDHFRGDFAAARDRLHGSLLAHPDNFLLRYAYACALAEEKDAAAAAILEQLARDEPNHGLARLGLIMRHALVGDAAAVLRGLTPELQAWARRDLSYSQNVAQAYAIVRRTEDALDWLEHAVELGFINYPFLTRDRLIDSIRGTERFERLMERVKREWEAFDA
jgi:serine/threonine protein kinase/tetratricopeptide (TPR) repeat protein